MLRSKNVSQEKETLNLLGILLIPVSCATLSGILSVKLHSIFTLASDLA